MAVDTSPSAPIIGAAIHLIPGVHSSSSKAIPSILIFSKSCLNSEIFKPWKNLALLLKTRLSLFDERFYNNTLPKAALCAGYFLPISILVLKNSKLSAFAI